MTDYGSNQYQRFDLLEFLYLQNIGLKRLRHDRNGSCRFQLAAGPWK